MLYTIAYRDARGALAHTEVDADSVDDAKAKSGVNPKRIKSVKEKGANALSKLLESSPPLPVQIAVLASVGASVTAGRPVDVEFMEQVKADPQLRGKADEIRKLTLTSERMRHLKFDETAVMLTEVGERTQTLGKSISDSAKMLSETYKLQSMMSKGAKPQIILLIMLLFVLCGMPFMFAPIFEQLGPDSGVRVETNGGTSLLFGIKWLVENAWMVALAAVVGLVVMWSKLWRWLRFRPFFRQFDELDKAKRAMRFTTAYIPLDSAEVSATEVLSRFRDTSKGVDREVYAAMYKEVEKGRPMSQTFDPTRWPQAFIRTVSGIEQINTELRAETLMTVKGVLSLLMDRITEKLVGTFKLLAWLILFAVIGIMLYGVYLPLMTMST